MIYKIFKTRAFHIFAHSQVALVCVFFIVDFKSFAQELSSVSGKVIDAKTKEPLPGATVFLANTTIGTSANETGAFTLTKIPQGKYDFTVSMVGYTSYTKPILFSSNNLERLVISLEPASIQLNTVTVQAHREKQDQYYYSQFEKIFLGTTQNSSHCKIVNPFDIFVYKDGDKIIADANKPIIVENKALGYEIFYELKEFVIKIDDRSFSMAGIPRFEELTPESEKQKKKWLKERDRAYFGSVSHFLISLRRNELSLNHFEIRNADGNLLTKQEIVRDSSIRYEGTMSITFQGEYTEPGYSGYSRFASYQNSEIKFKGDPITIYSNGYFEDFHNLLLDGYMDWNANIAEMVPLGYQPTHPSKK